MNGLFDSNHERRVLAWLSQNWNRPRVIIVGSGFTRNSIHPSNMTIPLWEHLSTAIEKSLGVEHGAFDALQLPDIHAAQFGSRGPLRELLAEQLNDNSLHAGKAHDALWESQPAAVVTTNFLDTVLEKSRPRRAQVVVRDSDLGAPIASHMRQVVYLHGHRKDRRTWVAGRQEYEQLPLKRPLIHAKVRQLLAEFPALIVGYSLADPDFHLIYGDTMRSMGKARPSGLALLPATTSRHPKLVAEELNQKYWSTLRLNVVVFSHSASQDPNESYARFFKLTERVSTVSQLLVALKKPPTPREVRSVFAQNIETGRSALNDPDLADVLDTPDERRRWWREVLARSLDDSSRTKATQASTSTNLWRHRTTEAREGERTPPRGQKSDPRMSSVDRAIWCKGPDKWRKSLTVAKLLDWMDAGDETTRRLEQLLRVRALRVDVQQWLQVALSDADAAPRFADQSNVAALAVLTNGDRRALREVRQLAGMYAESKVSAEIGRYLAESAGRVRRPVRGKWIDKLKGAFRLMARGERDRARNEYLSIYKGLIHEDHGGPDERELSLLAYFAISGVLGATAWNRELSEIEDLWRKRDILKTDPVVRRWLERTRALCESARKAKTRKDEDAGYESRRMSWSATPAELWQHYENANNLGAPLSLRREILGALLGTIPSAAHELDERLALHMEETGDWLESAFNAGEFSVNRSSVVQELPKLGAAQRKQAAHAVARKVFGGSTMALPAESLPRKARLGVLAACPEIIPQNYLNRALRFLRWNSWHDEQYGEVAKAVAKVAHICSWRDVSPILIELVQIAKRNRGLRRELLWGHMRLPWEHWSECDGFWGLKGMEFLRSFLDGAEPLSNGHAGWLIRSLFDTAPRGPIRRLAMRWLRSPRLDLKDDDTLRAATSIATSIATRVPREVAVFNAIKRRPTLGLMSIVLSSETRKSIHGWGMVRFEHWVDREGWKSSRRARSLGPSDDVEETECLVSLIQKRSSRTAVCIDRIFGLIDRTWSVLPALAPILHPQFWQERWHRLLSVLRVGGHARAPKSWLLARVQLVKDVFFVPDEIRQHFVASQELRFLRLCIIDAIGHGDDKLANNAIYVLPSLAWRISASDEANAIANALVAAANDIRIGVVHGAAFAAAYIATLARSNRVDARVVRAAKDVEALLRRDPLAIVRRQVVFGRAKAATHQIRQGLKDI